MSCSCNGRKTVTDTVNNGDHFLIWATNNGDWREVAASTLLTFMQDNLTFTSAGISYNTQYASPSATGFTVQITDGSDSIHLILTPDGDPPYATGTIVLPAFGNAIDKQEVLVNCIIAITTLTIDANGAPGGVVGAPSGLAANDFFRLKYDVGFQKWYRVG